MREQPLAEVLRQVAVRVEDAIAGEERLRALFDAVTAVGGALELRPTLTRIVEAAAALVGARYAALGVLDQTGAGLAEFVTVGFDPETIAEIGAPPHGHGILGLLIKDPQPVRLHDIKVHDASYGFPAHHPPMRSFLGVPVRVGDRVFGNLYLTEKQGGADFTAEDEQAVVALASAAAVAVENAALYERSEQRGRRLEATTEIQQAVLEHRPISEVLDLVAERAREVTQGETALVVLQDDEPGLAVCAVAGTEIGAWASSRLPLEGPLVDVLQRGATVHLARGAEIPGLETTGSALMVPFTGPDETGGAIVVTRTTSENVRPVEEDIDALRGFANHVSIALSLVRAQSDRAALAIVQDRERIARDLHDVVIQRLFAVGINLQGIRSQPTRPDAGHLLGTAVDHLDRTIQDIRTAIFELERNSDEAGLRAQVLDVIAAVPAGLRPRLSLSGPVDLAVSPAVGGALLAVLGECLSNATRHARTDEVDVQLTVDHETVTLVVTDDGIGFAPGGRESGLRNLRDRAADLGGTCTVTSAPGSGTEVRWSVPLPPLDDSSTGT